MPITKLSLSKISCQFAKSVGRAGPMNLPFFNAALVERALVAVRVTVAAAHLATELPTMSDAIMNNEFAT